MVEVGDSVRLIIKPQYNNGKSITYTADVIGIKGNKILIKTRMGERLDIDEESISECLYLSSVGRGRDGKKDY